MGLGRQWSTHAALAALAIAAPAAAQPASDAPVPTARYERPPEGVDPSILSRPLPEPPPPPTAAPPPTAGPIVALPEAPVVRRRGGQAPSSLETTTVAPRERPWERPFIGAAEPSPRPPVQAPVSQPSPVAAAPRPVAPPPARMPATTRRIELQIGAFADRANAERAAREARAAGPTRIQSVTVGGVTYHRVIVGPGDETRLRAALAQLGYRDARPPRS